VDVYRIFDTGKREFLFPLDEGVGEVLTALSGLDPATPLPPELPVRLMSRDDLGRQLETDFPWIQGNIPVYSPRAFETLAPLLTQYGRPIKLTDHDAGREFVGLHVAHALDALDYERSEITRFSSGRIMTIDRHVFRPESIGDILLFRLKDVSRAGWTYVTDAYVRTVEDAGLQSPEFDLLWADPEENYP